MNNVMEYQGYMARIAYDADDQSFYGDVIDLRDTIAFTGRSVGELQDSFRRAVDTYLQYCSERGDVPERPFSGKVQLRLEPRTHRAASIAAASAGMSLNRFLTSCVEARIAEPDSGPGGDSTVVAHATRARATTPPAQVAER